MPSFSFPIPHSRLFQARPEYSSQKPPTGDLVQANDILINVSFGRITATDNTTVELISKYNPVENYLEIDIPDHYMEFIELVEFGPYFRRFIDWLLDVDNVLNRIDGDPGDILVRNDSNQWVPINVLPRSFTFVVADWAAGTANEITIIGSGTSGPGQIGPHNYDNLGPYQVLVFSESGNIVTQVDVEVETNIITGDVTLRKSGLAPAFDGRAVVSSII